MYISRFQFYFCSRKMFFKTYLKRFIPYFYNQNPYFYNHNKNLYNKFNF